MGLTYHQYRYSQSAPLPDAVLEEILQLAAAVFPSLTMEDARWRLQHMPDGSTFCARADERLVGFKTGYATKQKYYYSWLGGVHADWKRQGIARRLMQDQHQWLAERGYQVVETRTQASNQAMCALNLASGFEQVGSRRKALGLQLAFEKRLVATDDANLG